MIFFKVGVPRNNNQEFCSIILKESVDSWYPQSDYFVVWGSLKDWIKFCDNFKP